MFLHTGYGKDQRHKCGFISLSLEYNGLSAVTVPFQSLEGARVGFVRSQIYPNMVSLYGHRRSVRLIAEDSCLAVPQRILPRF